MLRPRDNNIPAVALASPRKTVPTVNPWNKLDCDEPSETLPKQIVLRL
jgi:hypothetical protein